MSASPKPSKDPGSLELVLGHTFQNKNLLVEALTHPSLEGQANYQRLEFLGDRVIGMIASDLLFKTFPGEREGQLSRRFSALVRRETLAQIGSEIELAQYIRMTVTTEKSGGLTNASILSDVVEALIGALYLDGGPDAAKAFVEGFWAKDLDAKQAPKDAKSALQEWAQGRGRPLPEYKVESSEGPDHAPRFTVSVGVEGAGIKSATGPSKQEAGTKAAEALYQHIQLNEKSKQ